MTKEQIEAYLSAEESSHSATSMVTRIIFKNGKIQLAHFVKDSQEITLKMQNKWIVTFLDKPIGISTINGDEIEALKVGETPFR